MIVMINFTPVPRRDYRIGVPQADGYEEVFNSDAVSFGGSGVRNEGTRSVEGIPWHCFGQSVTVTVPPLAAIYLKPVFAATETDPDRPAEDRESGDSGTGPDRSAEDRESGNSESKTGPSGTVVS